MEKEQKDNEKIAKGSGIAPGRYTGASQLMQFTKDGTVSYDDKPMGICHLEVTKDDRIKIAFPDPDLGRGKRNEVTLKLSATKPRATWTTAFGKETYRVTAIPFSPKMFLFRLEHLKKGALIAGAQEFYAVELKKPELAAPIQECKPNQVAKLLLPTLWSLRCRVRWPSRSRRNVVLSSLDSR